MRWPPTDESPYKLDLGIAFRSPGDKLLPATLDRVPVVDRKQAYSLFQREVSEMGDTDADVITRRSRVLEVAACQSVSRLFRVLSKASRRSTA
jgi:hypothetical protein